MKIQVCRTATLLHNGRGKGFAGPKPIKGMSSEAKLAQNAEWFYLCIFRSAVRADFE